MAEDDSGLMITATVSGQGSQPGVVFSYPDGAAHRITDDLNNYSSLG